MSLLFMCIKQRGFIKKTLYSYNFGWFLCEFITIFFCYQDPIPRFLNWVRIRIQPNDTVPTGSGSRSETLLYTDETILFTDWTILFTDGPFFTDGTVLFTDGPFFLLTGPFFLLTDRSLLTGRSFYWRDLSDLLMGPLF